MPPPSSKAQDDTSEAPNNVHFDREVKVMSMFCDNAKTYIQLSSAALVLTLTFVRQILHVPDDKNIANIWMMLMWGCFLLAVLAGAFYQYLAVKYLQGLANSEAGNEWEWLQPGVIYAVMLAAFYGGAVVFTVYAISRLT